MRRQAMAKRKDSGIPEAVRRDGGLSATFVNTLSAKRRSFSTYAELLAWGVRCGAVTAGDAERLERSAAERPDDARAVARRGLELLGVLGRVFAARVEKKAPAAADVEALNAELASAYAARRLVQAERAFRLAWGDRGGDDFDRVLWPVLESAVEVLTSKYYFRVGRCAGEDCDLLFVDRTPGSPRRWCSMKACGSKVSTRRHYRRSVKPERERSKRRIQEAREKRWRELRAAQERDAAPSTPLADGKPPGPRVA